MNPHAFAVNIEFILRHVFDCDRGGLAGLIDADAIEHSCYVPIAAALGFLYASGDEGKRFEIEEFITNYDYYLDFGISELIDFTSKERTIDGCTYKLEFENGEEALNKIIEDLREVCK